MSHLLVLVLLQLVLTTTLVALCETTAARRLLVAERRVIPLEFLASSTFITITTTISSSSRLHIQLVTGGSLHVVRVVAQLDGHRDRVSVTLLVTAVLHTARPQYSAVA